LVRYYHADYLGNVRLVTYWQSNKVQTDYSARYKPFGEVIVLSSKTDPKFGFTGEWLDATGLYYLRARYYDPTIGRFVSQDPVLGRISTPQSHNRYAYVGNNPMGFTDPTGMDFLGDVWNAIVGGAICTITLPVCMAQLIAGTADWLANRASWQEQVGFGLGLLFAFVAGFAVGFAIAAFCVATLGIGCVVAAVVIAALVGSAVAAATYWGVTSILGGTPTREGFDYAFAWGGIVGGIGGGLGAAKAMSKIGPRPVYDSKSQDHVWPRHHDYTDSYYADRSKFLDGEGGQDFATEVYERARGRYTVGGNGNYVYIAEDMGRDVGEGYPGGKPEFGPWGPQRGGTVIVNPLDGHVITQYPGVPSWSP
jgi:RHS repeat-associated protein